MCLQKLQRWVEVIANRSQRVGEKHGDNIENKGLRNQYQRDFDRLIFSSAFKRLQNKTQVFPLPGTAQVHNRLTHSLEVASVGRSLGSLVGKEIAQLLQLLKEVPDEIVDFYRHELKDVILAACLAHDIGNPCFGHSGEKIISDYFSELKKYPSRLKGRKKELDKISDAEWNDLFNFEGNANTLRMLTTEYFGKLPGGLRLTYLTLASCIKYPWDAMTMEGFPQEDARKLGIKPHKYGFFQEQKILIEEIAKTFNLIYSEKTLSKNLSKTQTPLDRNIFRRHPFVYLVEAADDICYNIMDLEDAQKLGIFSTETVKNYFCKLYCEIKDTFSRDDRGGTDFFDKGNLGDYWAMVEKEKKIKDEREKIVYLRSKCINALTQATASVFMAHWEKIVEGKSSPLLTLITKDYNIHTFKEIKEISVEKIYKHPTVTETMVGASYILPELLDGFLPSILSPDIGEHSFREEKIFSLINSQFSGGDLNEFKKQPPYNRILSLLDFLTGMTDAYISEYYLKLKGIDHPKHSI